MPLNCKPGQMVYVFRTPPSDRDLLGHVCTVLSPEPHPFTGEPGWRVDPPTARGDCLLDQYLKPLGNPPEDATDESMTWCPRPERVEAMS